MPSRPNFRRNQSTNASLSREIIPAGSIRCNQLITTFGVGAIVDFVDYTAIIAGIDDWDYPADESIEKRKIFNENLNIITGAEYFLSPKTQIKINNFSTSNDVPAYLFPEKMYCPKCGRIYNVNEIVNNKNRCPSCQIPVTPSRFVVLCEKGHLEDFPYSWWVHKGSTCSSKKTNPSIRMYSVGNRNDMDSLYIECLDCKEKRSMGTIFADNALIDYKCNGLFPHLRDPRHFSQNGCDEKMKVRIRSSSGIYFPIVKSALSIPPWSKGAVQIILQNYDMLKFISDENILKAIRSKLSQHISISLSDDEIQCAWQSVTERKSGKSFRTIEKVMFDEYEALCKDETEITEEFSSYTVNVPDKYQKYFSKVTVVDKLTEVQAFCGFSRLNRNTTKSTPISVYSKKWLPAVKLSGEGIFIKFNSEVLLQWIIINQNRYELMEQRLSAAHIDFSENIPLYVVLHTFSHMFIKEVANSCGYNTASLKEKIYCSYSSETKKIKMCGVLVYVSTSDSDSSLGGLISVADNILVLKSIIDNMLEKAEWCSGDPLCISSTAQGYKSLNYSACYDCVLLPETSCERFNILLDRASIVGLPENRNIGLFSDLFVEM